MKLYLIDGNSYVYRAFYGIRGLTDSAGRPTNAVYGFTNMLLKIIREKKPDALAVSFDTPHPTERHELFEDYKAHRPETPDELTSQFPEVKRMIGAFNIPIFEEPGYEADDVLATLAERAAGEGAEVYVVTGDKDMLQLVTDAVKVYDPMKDRVLDADYVREKLGLPPERVVEYMALVGDATDNIPGAKGIGDKTASALLKEFDSLDEILEHPERIEKPRTRKLVEQSMDDIKMSRKLAQINSRVPLEVEVEDLRAKEPDWHALLGLFREFEFSSLMKLIPSGGGAREGVKCEVVTDPKVLEDFMGGIKHEFAVCAETAGRLQVGDELVGFSLCASKEGAAYIPLTHEGELDQMDKAKAISILKPYAEDEGVTKDGHNLKTDIIALRGEGIETRGMLCDVMLASHLLNPLRTDHSLANVCLEYLGTKKKTRVEVAGKKSFQKLSVEKAAPYACEHASVALELAGMLFEKLEDEGLGEVYEKIEMPLIYVLAGMEEAGMKLDSALLEDFSKEMERALDAIEKRIYFLAGGEFNIGSPKQLAKVLFEQLGLRPGKKKKTGYSTEVGVLEELALEHELPGEVLNWRSLSKLKSTYVDVLPGLVNPKTGRLHTTFNQAATATGRLSSSNPNLQNIPIRGDWGTRIREAFIAEEGGLLVSADYSQIELRILAHISGDRALTEAFKEGVDVHARTAAEIFGVTPKKVTSEMRRVAKTVNFGVVYGITSFGLSQTLGVSRPEAQEYINLYFKRHAGVKDYIDRIIAETREKGYTETLYGRKRPVPELKSRNAQKRQFGERLAMNTPIQGTAADVIKLAMINISERIRKEKLEGRMILQVHDELVFECPKAEEKKFLKLVSEEMEGAASLDVPLSVDIGSGANWAQAHT
jgi:DNA polymerase-1